MREAPVVRPLLEASLAIDVGRWHRQGLLTLPVSSSACNGRAAALACGSGATASRSISGWKRMADHPASRVFQLDEVHFRGDRPWFICSRYHRRPALTSAASAGCVGCAAIWRMIPNWSSKAIAGSGERRQAFAGQRTIRGWLTASRGAAVMHAKTGAALRCIPLHCGGPIGIGAWRYKIQSSPRCRPCADRQKVAISACPARLLPFRTDEG
jgi:hypothetical protein